MDDSLPITQRSLFPEEPVQPDQPPVPGTLILCRYNLPSTLQPWIHPFHVGVVEAPGDDPDEWNGWISERQFCEKRKRIRIRYNFGVRHEFINALIPITAEQAALSHREKIALFLGNEALNKYDRTSGIQRPESSGADNNCLSEHQFGERKV